MKIPKNNKNTIKILQEFENEKILQDVAIGKILGDCYISDVGTLNFCHSIKQKEYIEHCYELFKKYTRSGLKLHINKRNNKRHEMLYFDTKAIFKKELQLFYKFDENTKKRIKIIPSNMEELLTPIGLAFWIMDDGYFDKPNLKICTHSFTEKEVIILKEILENKFNLICKIRKEKINPTHSLPGGGSDSDLFWYVLFIKKESFPNLKNLIGKYIIPSMKYKLGE